MCFILLTAVTKSHQFIGTWPLWAACFGLFASSLDRAWDVALFCAGVVVALIGGSFIAPFLIMLKLNKQK